MEYRLGDIAKYINEKISVSEIENSKYISTENMLPNRKGIVCSNKGPRQNKVNYFRKGDILISNIRPYFKKIWYATFDGGCSNDVLVIRVKDKDMISSKYLYYLLSRDIFFNYVMSGSKGTKMPRGDKKQILRYTIKVPTLKKQYKIISIIDVIDKKIELNNQINNNLSNLERTLYKEILKKISEKKILKLGDLCNIKYGKGLPTTKIEKEGYPVYGGNGIIGYYREYLYEYSQVLISCRGAASGNVIVSRPKSFVTNNSLILECDRKYYHYLKQYSLDNNYYEYTTGSAQPQITIDNIKDISINIPGDNFLNEFNRQSDELEKKYFTNLDEISILEQLRDILLPKLMNGEIDLN